MLMTKLKTHKVLNIKCSPNSHLYIFRVRIEYSKRIFILTCDFSYF